MSLSPVVMQVEEAYALMLQTTDDAQRRQAHEWLLAFQSSAEAWTAGAGLIASGSSSEARVFGATMLCNKLKGAMGGGLSPTDALGLRSELLRLLVGVTDGKLRAQVCRAIAALVGCCEGDGAQATVSLLASSHVASLRVEAILELLTLIPSAGGWRSDGEVSVVLSLQCELLTFALCEGAPFPPQLPPTCAPAGPGWTRSSELRGAVLRSAVAWAALPSSEEGLCLSMLAELPCFTPLIACVRGDSGRAVQRQAVELCVAALEQETTNPGVRGTFLPFVGAELTLQFIEALGSSLEPLLATASRGEGHSDDEGGEEEEEAANVALVALAATLLAKASAVLVEGAASPPAALNLLRLLVHCAGHAHRAIAEAACTPALWAPLLGVTEGWESGLRSQLQSSVAQIILARLAFPADDQVRPPYRARVASRCHAN